MTLISQAFTAALFHFLWQGTAVAVCLSLASFLLRRRSPNVRYVAGCIALLVMALLPIVTAWSLYQPAAGSTEIAPPAANLTSGFPFFGSRMSGFDVGAVVPRADAMVAVRDWAIPVWALGVVLFSVRLLWGYGHVRRLLHSSAPSAAILETAIRVAGRMGVTHRFTVMVSSLTDGPGVVGWLRPVILLPPATALGLTPQQLEAVLAHELAHIRRHDYLVNLGQTLIEALLFYHPAVWWVSSRVRRERELCCDDLAVETVGNALSYARALTALERLRLGPPQLAMGAADGSLSHRIRRIMGRESESSRLSVVSGLVALVLGATVLGATSLTSTVGKQRGEARQAETRSARPPLEVPPAAPAPPVPAPAPLSQTPTPPGSSPAAPVPPPPPAPAPQPPAQTSGTRLFFGSADDDGVAWVLFRDGRTWTYGSSVDQAEARIDRRDFTGDGLWARVDGSTYVIQDASFLENVDALMEPLDTHGEEMRAMGQEMRELGEQMRRLGEQMREVRVDVPDLGPQIAQIREMLQSQASLQDLGRLQAEIGRLQGAIGRVQSGAGRRQAEIGRRQAAIGRQQAEIGRRQAAIGRQQAEAYRAASATLVDRIREAIDAGLATPLD